MHWATIQFLKESIGNGPIFPNFLEKSAIFLKKSGIFLDFSQFFLIFSNFLQKNVNLFFRKSQKIEKSSIFRKKVKKLKKS